MAVSLAMLLCGYFSRNTETILKHRLASENFFCCIYKCIFSKQKSIWTSNAMGKFIIILFYAHSIYSSTSCDLAQILCSPIASRNLSSPYYLSLLFLIHIIFHLALLFLLLWNASSMRQHSLYILSFYVSQVFAWCLAHIRYPNIYWTN